MHLDPEDHNGSTLDKDKYDRSVNSRIQIRSMDTKYITSAEYICTKYKSASCQRAVGIFRIFVWKRGKCSSVER